MRLISKARDYYDGCQAQDREPTPVYVRGEKCVLEVEWTSYKAARRQGLGRAPEALVPYLEAVGKMPEFCGSYFERVPGALRRSGLSNRQVHVSLQAAPTVLLCCGEAYAFWLCTPPCATYDGERESRRGCDDVSGIRACVEGIETGSPDVDLWKRQALAYLDAKEGLGGGHGDLYFDNDEGVERWRQDHVSLLKGPHDGAHRAFDRPLVLIQKIVRPYGSMDMVRVTVDPLLTDLAFQPRMDPWSLWQKIDSYLGNQLSRQMDPDSARDNALIVHAHGFDAQSFKRVSPGERKARRRARHKE